MKKFLFLAFMALSFAACSSSSDDDNTTVYEAIPSNFFQSKDSIHQYAITTDYIYKYTKKGTDKVWKKPVTIPAPVIVDLGYGEKKTIEYSNIGLLLESDNYLFTYLWAYYESKVDNPFDVNRLDDFIGVYSSDGDFIKNVSFKKYFLYPVLIEMNKKMFVLADGSVYKKGFTIFNDKLEVIESNNDMEVAFYDKSKFINNKTYISYDDNSFVLGDLDHGVKRFDISQFVKEQYPNEANQPKYVISDATITDNIVNIKINLTFYDGKKGTTIAKVDINTKEIN